MLRTLRNLARAFKHNLATILRAQGEVVLSATFYPTIATQFLKDHKDQHEMSNAQMISE
jgi:hypothetical protein